MSEVSHYITAYFLRYMHTRYMKSSFAETYRNFLYKLHGKNPRIYRIKNATFSGYCFYTNPNISEIFISALMYL